METELKFQVPASARPALLRALRAGKLGSTRLRAIYADTPDHTLAAARLAWRLRLEGRRWVQTLKGAGDGMAVRLEHEVALPAQRGTPDFDPTLHAGTAAGERLAAVLAKAGAESSPDGSLAPVQPLYATDIRRLHRRVRHGGATIEIAYDRGHITAGEQRLAVDEIEFELVSGPPAALVALAMRWVAAHGLWWDCRTKSERGFRLATGVGFAPAARALPAPEPAPVDAAAAWREALLATLAQVMANAAELADGSPAPEHLHQVRVGLRRLRSVLRELAGFSADPLAARELDSAWAEPFGALGSARDAQVHAQSLWPAIVAAGAPPVSWPASAASVSPQQVVLAPRFSALALRTLALAWQAPPALSAPWPEQAREVLRRIWRRARADAEQFEQAPVEQQHRLRKRLKRLRYVSELLAPLLPTKPLRSWSAELSRCLERLGELNDVHTAAAACRERAEQEPRAWFAVGWLAAAEAERRRRAAKALARLLKTPRPWRAAGG